MINIGLKLWSTNTHFTDEIYEMYENNFFSYIELFSVPNSFTETIYYWKEKHIPYVIHASHSMTGLNFSKNEMKNENIFLTNEAKAFADKLNADKIIFHPGLDGSIDETINQIKFVYDSRFVIENKPAVGINNEKCIGSSIGEIKRIITECNTMFCLDFGHAIAAANSYLIDPMLFIESFMELNPAIYHLTDGDYSSTKDHHYHYGKGTFPLKEIFELLPNHSFVTNEAKRKNSNSLKEIINDTQYTKSFFN